jgi:CP family cyanate transporter-like MFS transporter
MAGMSQSVGYLIGAAGPLTAGILRDHSSSWQSALWLVVGVSVLQTWFAYGAGRKAQIGA